MKVIWPVNYTSVQSSISLHIHAHRGKTPCEVLLCYLLILFFTEVIPVLQDGRKISIGDCALFKPPQDAPPFIGIIRWLTSGKEDNLKLGVNWLYRPAEVKLAKGILPEAAPNEVFYSFHKDEIPAASLLHPCKVAFLHKGVELPSGISSFVCRRVYDIANKCLWWLSDQDYINERQEEVDQLLDKTRIEMHGAVQSGGRSPKSLNGPTSTPQLKHGSDSLQNNATSLTSQVKGKKRERGDQGSDPIKRERSFKADDGDSGQFRPENMLKSEIARMTDKGGLIDFQGVEKLVQLMQPDRGEKKIDLACRMMLVDAIAATDKVDCLGRFVQLRGLPVLDEWLQEVHKGKTGDGSSPKESDKAVEEFLFALLRALDKLPINLHALQTCNVGKSVNNLRSHKNLEIQKKARSLVDTWKKRVEAEMKINDAKPGSSQAVSWPSKPGFPEVSQGGNRRTGGSSEVPMKSSTTQPSASKTTTVKFGHGETIAKPMSSSPGSMKLSVSLPSPVGINLKDQHSKVAVDGGTADLPLTTIKEEKSSSSSQSQNNSQSCSSEHAKIVGCSWKEDARSSTAGSISVSKISSGSSRHRKSSNGFQGSAISGGKNEMGLGKCGFLNKNSPSEKMLQSRLTCEKPLDMPLVDHGNSRLIVRFPNPGRSPAWSASGGSFEDPSIVVSRASSPGLPEKHDHYDRKVKGKSDACRVNVASDVNIESWQSNDVKDGLAGSDEGDRSPAAVLIEERSRTGDEIGKLTEASKASCSSSGNEAKLGKSFEDSFSSINALIESCVKYSEAGAPMSFGDDVGMNLLASVATGEISNSELVSPIGSPGRNSPVLEDSCMGNDVKLSSSCEDVARNEDQADDCANCDTEKQGNILDPSQVNNGSQHPTTHASTNFSGCSKPTSSFAEEKTLECSEHLHSSIMDLQQTADPCLKCDEKLDEITASVAMSLADTKDEAAEDERANQLCEEKKSGLTGVSADNVPDSKLKVRSPLFENKKIDHFDEKIGESSVAAASDTIRGSIGDTCDIDNAVSSVKLEKEVVEESPSCPSLEMNGENKNIVHEELNGGLSTMQKPPPVAMSCSEFVEGNSEDAILLTGSGNVLGTENDDSKTEQGDEMEARSHAEQSDKQRMEQASNVPPAHDEQVGTGLGLTVSGHNGERADAEESSERKEVLEQRSGGSASYEESPVIPVQETEHCVKPSGPKSTGVEAGETEVCVFTADASSLSIAAGSDMTAKRDFDLNEGFSMDDGNQGEPVHSELPRCLSAVNLPSPLPFPISSMSGSGLPASITVAAAAKGPFVPPENLLRSKGELGWKGSAATSAFRPAEPRKVLEMPLITTDISLPDTTASKQGRPPLDIDLNVADERLDEDMASQGSAPETDSEFGPFNNRVLARDEMFDSSAPGRSAGGLDLDLNRVDEGADIGQFSTSTSRRLEVPLLLVKSSLSGGFPNGGVNVLRDFDLNNGPGLDEVGAEQAPRSQHAKSSVPFLAPATGLRMNNTELGNLSSWFPSGNSYSAMTTPTFFPDRREQPYPINATAGAQRILGPPTGGTTFGHDVYRGPVLSSSPAVAFPPATPFQYPGFHFGTSFPFPSTTFSGGSTTYMDSSSGGALGFPTIPSQLVGPAGSVSSHYPRPYVISLPDGSSKGGAESSRKWGRHGLDLNAGPGGTDTERRDERLPSASRQLSLASSQVVTEEQARMYQAAGGSLKRREPEGGWDVDRFSHRQPSWQ
ncbi:hypothetical protein HHK36_007090 [Tetracentron sinense]|uniref:Uncharacterized protein n=1 Tax=Tetracentron sinense TaxID=13715 RepID=A0A834ZM13_TETSI|nr:hypothetical protein HHK36_007090 [Tetracentron sinense]